MSFELHDCTAMTLKVQQAILLYGQDKPHTGIAYATIHPVDCRDDMSQPAILAGRALDRASLKAVCSALLKAARKRSGVLPQTILSVGLEHVVWWQPPGLRTYFFDCRPAADGAVSVGRRAGVAPAPGIVFVAEGQRLRAYAVKGRTRPVVEAALWHLPMMNVWQDGRVCTGTMPLPDGTLSDSTAAWEKSFWDSHFTHPNHAGAVRYKGGLHQFSIDLLDGKFRRFPARVLRPVEGLTLGRLVERLDAVGA